MLKILSQALSDIRDAEMNGDTPEESLRIAMAALLVHVSAADGHSSVEEMGKIGQLLMKRFALSEEECDLLMSEGKNQDENAVDLYGFTKTLTQELDQSGRQQFVKMMWEVILADGAIDDFESHLIWRVSDLLGVSTRDRVLLRQEVENEKV